MDAALLQLWNQVDGSWDRSIATLTSHTPSTFADWFKNVRPTATPPLSTTGAALTALDSSAINYGPTVVGDNGYHQLTNGGGVSLQRGGTCSGSVPSVAVFAASDNSMASQRWKFTSNGDGTVRIDDSCPIPLYLTAPATGFSLDGNATAGQAVTANTANASSTSQNWASIFSIY